MADKYWLGLAAAVAQVTTIGITAYDAATTYTITVGGVTVSAIAAGGANQTATALAAAWNASTHPYLTGVTAVASTSNVALTADTAGVPFVAAGSVSGGTGTISTTATTASSGPNHYDTAANWSSGTIPANGDNVYIRDSNVPILWGLAQSGVAPSLLVVERSFSAQIGLPYRKFRTATGYDTSVAEYRDTYLKTAAAASRIGERSSGSNAGSSLIKIDYHTAAVAVEVHGSGRSIDELPPVMLRMNNASAALKVYGASKVGACFETASESGQCSSISAFRSAGGAQSGVGIPEIYVGAGLVQATHQQSAGLAVLKNAPTTVKIEPGAKITLAGAGTITTLEKRGDLIVTGAYAVTSLRG